jgi:hypothetical protein
MNANSSLQRIRAAQPQVASFLSTVADWVFQLLDAGSDNIRKVDDKTRGSVYSNRTKASIVSDTLVRLMWKARMDQAVWNRGIRPWVERGAARFANQNLMFWFKKLGEDGRPCQNDTRPAKGAMGLLPTKSSTVHVYLLYKLGPDDEIAQVTVKAFYNDEEVWAFDLPRPAAGSGVATPTQTPSPRAQPRVRIGPKSTPSIDERPTAKVGFGGQPQESIDETGENADKVSTQLDLL